VYWATPGRRQHKRLLVERALPQGSAPHAGLPQPRQRLPQPHGSAQQRQAAHPRAPRPPHQDPLLDYEVARVCDDSCAHAGNGVCDDGRGGNVSRPVLDGLLAWNHVRCDLGRDCGDCGPAHLRVPAGAGG
jgi:hypothetical protein